MSNVQKLGSRVVAVDWAVAKSFYHPSQGAFVFAGLARPPISGLHHAYGNCRAVEDDGKQALGDVSMLLPAPGAVTAVHKVVHCSTKASVFITQARSFMHGSFMLLHFAAAGARFWR